MKKFLILTVGVLLAGAARADVVWKAEPPANVPDRVPLVQVVPTRVSRAMMQQRAAMLGFPPRASFVKTPVGLALQSGPLLYQANALGSEFFANTDLYLAGKPGQEPIPDERARSLAEGFLKEQFPRILQEGKVLRVRHLWNQVQDLKESVPERPTQDESVVELGRFLGDIPVVGPGDKARIHLANDGTITGAHAVWRHTRIIGVLIGLLKYDDARNAFLRQMEAEMGDGSVRVFVNAIQFGYYSRPENQEQGWYQPCYLFSVSFFNEKLQQETGARLIPVPAMDPKELREPLEMPPPEPNNGDRSRILLDGVKPPEMPSVVPVVRVLPTRISADLANRRFIQFGGKPETTEEAGRGLLVKDGTSNTVLYQDDRGTEFFGHLDRFMNETPGEAPPISDEEAIKSASEWIKGLGDVQEIGLLLPAVQRIRQAAANTDTGKEEPPTSDEAIVTFGRQIPNPKGQFPVPLVGQGTGIRVHVDNFGKVTGYHRVWRALEPTEDMLEILPYAEQENLFIRKLLPDLGNSVAKVTDVQFGYWSRPEGFRQDWLLPAVVFEVDLIDPATGEVTAHRQIPIPASRNQPEDLEDPGAADLPQTDEDSRAADTVPILFGDLDGDTKVTTLDAAMAMRLFGGLVDSADVPPSQLTAGDVAPAGSADGLIGLNDGLRILRSIFQLDDISAGP